MQRYIKQLVEDIRMATHNLKPPHELWEISKADPTDELELEDMSHIEQYLFGEKQPIAQITTIAQEQLPPPDKLQKGQKTQLASELEKLLQYFHFYLDFPEDYPTHLRYSFIYNFWTEKHVPLSFGRNHIEFCNYEEKDCPFAGYCTACADFSTQIKPDDDQQNNPDYDPNENNDLPF